MSAMRLMLLLLFALFATTGSAFPQTFAIGTYQSKDNDGLISSIAVTNLPSGKQQLFEDSNALLVSPDSCQVNIKGRRIVPEHYNQSDLPNGEFVFCAFTNCAGMPACTQADVTFSPGRYFTQSTNQICSAWQDGETKCFTMIRPATNLNINGATLHRRKQ